MRRRGVARVSALSSALWLGLWTGPALAAEATDVLDAIDGDDLFDANAELSYRAHAKTAKVLREDVRAGGQADVVEFQYFEHSHQVIPRLRVGVFQDIELFAALPYTVWEQRMGWFHPRNGSARDPRRKGYSTFLRDMCTYGGVGAELPKRPVACDKYYPGAHRNTLSGNSTSWPVNHEYQTDSDGKPEAGDWNGADTDWDINPDAETPEPNFNSIRGAVAWSVANGYYFFPKGIGDAELGLAFSPYSIARFNDKRDSAMPTMRIEVKYQLPSGPVDTPGPNPNRREKLGGTLERFEPGGTGSGLHRLSASVNMSKRLKLFDPYLGFNYTVGIPQYYPRDAPERRWYDMPFWQQRAGMLAGVELAPLYYVPDVENVVDLRLIVGGTADYYARHRGPSEMSDVLNKWTYVDHYVALLGRVALVLSVPFVTLRALVEAGHETPHMLTGETVGFDRNNNGLQENEINPFFNPVLDLPGRRVKVSETAILNGMMTLAITF